MSRHLVGARSVFAIQRGAVKTLNILLNVSLPGARGEIPYTVKSLIMAIFRMLRKYVKVCEAFLFQ